MAYTFTEKTFTDDSIFESLYSDSLADIQGGTVHFCTTLDTEDAKKQYVKGLICDQNYTNMKNIEVAKLHANKNNLDIEYLCTSPENLKIDKKFDVILNMEIVEHVEDVDFFLESCSKLLKSNGVMYVATLNKTLKSYLFAIIGAEYILRWLPIGTHEWEKFVKPEDLIKILSKYNLNLDDLSGLKFNPLKNSWNFSPDKSVNYIAKFIKN